MARKFLIALVILHFTFSQPPNLTKIVTKIHNLDRLATAVRFKRAPKMVPIGHNHGAVAAGARQFNVFSPHSKAFR